MLSARAYSFQRKSRLAVSLSWIGGYVNVVAFLSCGQFVSHMTGNTTSFGRALEGRVMDEARAVGLVLLCFLLGAAASACMTEVARRRGSRSKYVLPIAVEAVVLAFMGWGLHAYARPGVAQRGVPLGIAALAALAMGIQNATITRISGDVVRTTHVTGVVTDFGIEGVQFLLWCWDKLRGRWLQRGGRVLRVVRRNPSFQRVALLASIWGSFFLGVLVGSFLYWHWPAYALAPPVFFLAWIVLVDWRTPIAEVREIDLVDDPELSSLGVVRGMLPHGVGIYRFTYAPGGGGEGGRRRAPNFQLWVDHLPRHWKIIVLALNPQTRFDENAVMDLDMAVRKLHAQRRRLIISGVTPAQYRALDALGVTRLMDARNIVPDMEFALARLMAEVTIGHHEEHATT